MMAVKTRRIITVKCEAGMNNRSWYPAKLQIFQKKGGRKQARLNRVITASAYERKNVHHPFNSLKLNVTSTSIMS